MNPQKIFSEREDEVISLLLTGRSNKQIAQVLGISTRTVEFHLGNIYSKLKLARVLKQSYAYPTITCGNPQAA